VGKPCPCRKMMRRKKVLTVLLLIAVGMTAILYYKVKTKRSKTPQPKKVISTSLVTLYFYALDGEHFVAVKRSILKTDNLPQAAMEELLKGPAKGSGLYPVFWEGTKVREVRVKDGIAYVDFSKELTAYGGGSFVEQGIIGSTILTLTSFPQIERVQFLKEGKRFKYFPEGTEVDKPLGREGWENKIKNQRYQPQINRD